MHYLFHGSLEKCRCGDFNPGVNGGSCNTQSRCAQISRYTQICLHISKNLKLRIYELFKKGLILTCVSFQTATQMLRLHYYTINYNPFTITIAITITITQKSLQVIRDIRLKYTLVLSVSDVQKPLNSSGTQVHYVQCLGTKPGLVSCQLCCNGKATGEKNSIICLFSLFAHRLQHDLGLTCTL